MKNLIADIRHPAHLNFFRPVLEKLKNEGWNIDIVAIDRGKVYKITKKEYTDFNVYKLGKHRGTKFSIIFEANILRFFQMFFFLLRKKYHIGISVSSFILGSACKLKGTPNLQFYDDPEYKKHVRLQKLTSTKTYYPRIKEFGPEIETFNALKEWAYLSPAYFKPDNSVLKDYNLSENKYIFVREVINASLNYTSQDANLVATFAADFPKGYKVLLSLEDKKTKHLYPKDWIILEEPLRDIHSLIYNSALMVSSGDSMAREAALLGVPAIYCGIREMTANKKMIEKNMLFHRSPQETPAFMQKIVHGSFELTPQIEFRESLMNEWDDVTLFIENKIKQYTK